MAWYGTNAFAAIYGQSRLVASESDTSSLEFFGANGTPNFYVHLGTITSAGVESFTSDGLSDLQSFIVSDSWESVVVQVSSPIDIPNGGGLAIALVAQGQTLVKFFSSPQTNKRIPAGSYTVNLYGSAYDDGKGSFGWLIYYGAGYLSVPLTLEDAGGGSSIICPVLGSGIINAPTVVGSF